MGGIASIVEGDNIPIVLFLRDGDSSFHPRAVVRQEDGTLVGTVDLDHQSDGVYTSNSAPLVMPATNLVFVAYTVYVDPGHTQESLKYQKSMDTFARLLDAIKAKTDQMNFTVADHLDVNMRYHNDQREYGTGTPGDKWRGYP